MVSVFYLVSNLFINIIFPYSSFSVFFYIKKVKFYPSDNPENNFPLFNLYISRIPIFPFYPNTLILIM